MTMTGTNQQVQKFPAFHATPEQQQGPAFARPRPRPRKLQHPLSPEQLNFFWTTGYISLPGLFTPDEAREFQSEADRLYREATNDKNNLRYGFAKIEDRPDDGTRILWKIDPFHDLSRTFADMVRDRRICDALASIYDGREPRLFKDKLIYKPPHTRKHGLHQDYNWWQGYTTSLISVVIAIDAADESNGCTVVYPGYEKGLLTEPGTFGNLSREAIDPATAVKYIAQPGDVLMFHCFTPHEAGPNSSDRYRRQVFLTYNDSADGEHYQEHLEHHHWYKSHEYPPEMQQALYFR